jgi:large repetitive protein
MNSFKKVSLIIAAALTSTMLVSPAANANAGTVTLTVAGTAATGGTVVTTPVSLPVPADNSIDAADALKIAVTAVDTGTTVTAVATNATIVPALAGTTPVTASSGTSTLSIATGTGTAADFYVYTKSTAVGTVSITRAGTTTVYYVQGSNSAATTNSITLSAPTSGAAGTSQVLKVSAFDVFGNPKSGVTINTLVSSNGVATATALTTDTATATIGTKEQTLTLPASGSVVVTAYATVAAAVTGLAAPVGAVTATITVRDLAGELAAKNAELAVANAALATEKAGRAADKVASDKALADAKVASDFALATAKAAYKAQYNALATKWNKKNPKAKVALIK